jgi:hypothetical protein
VALVSFSDKGPVCLTYRRLIDLWRRRVLSPLQWDDMRVPSYQRLRQDRSFGLVAIMVYRRLLCFFSTGCGLLRLAVTLDSFFAKSARWLAVGLTALTLRNPERPPHLPGSAWTSAPSYRDPAGVWRARCLAPIPHGRFPSSLIEQGVLKWDQRLAVSTLKRSGFMVQAAVRSVYK